MIATMSLLLASILCSCGGSSAVASVIDEKVTGEKDAVMTDAAENAENMTVTENAIVIPDETTASAEMPSSDELTASTEIPGSDESTASTKISGSNESMDLSEEVTASEENSSATDSANYVDLTVLSATAVYAEVYDMMFYPEKYIGKTVKMKGLYDEFYDESTKKRYHACIIMDATACCAQGIEFVLTEDYKYPEDYPKEADDIVVEGVFDVYTEESGSYCTLRNSRLF